MDTLRFMTDHAGMVLACVVAAAFLKLAFYDLHRR